MYLEVTVGLLTLGGEELNDGAISVIEDVGVLQFEVGLISGEPTFDLIVEITTVAGSASGIQNYHYAICMQTQ